MTKKNKILVVEDDKFLRKLCVRKLENAGFTALTALDGEEGLRKAKEEKPDLILLDIVLPDINGFEVIKQLKKSQATAFIPVIFLTNLGQEENIKKGLELGADDYLVKAYFTPGDIMKKVEQLILKKRSK